MNKTNQYLDAVKAKTGAPSDYKIAQHLGITRQQMSKYRNKGEYLGGDAAMKAAQILEIDPLIILSAIQSEKAKTEKEKAVWTALFEKLGGMAASVLIATAVFSHPAPVQAAEHLTSYNNVYYVKSRRRKRPTLNPFRMMVEQLLSTT